jgi:hypothetical protein
MRLDVGQIDLLIEPRIGARGARQQGQRYERR